MKIKSLIWLCVALTIVCQSSFAEPYYGWVNEYDGNDANTIALWNFNSDQYYTLWDKDWQGVLPNQSGSHDHLWDARFDPALSSTISFGVSGKFGNGMSQSGYSGTDSDERVIVYHSKDVTGDPNYSSLFPEGSDPNLSVEMWVKFDDISDPNHQYLIDKGIGWNGTSGYGIRYKLGKLYWQLGDGTNQIYCVGNWTPSVGGWYHIAGTWDANSDTSTLYVNGEVVDSNTSPGAVIADVSDEILVIGNRNKANYNSVNGTIDQVRISGTAYEFAEVPVMENVDWDIEYDGTSPYTIALYHFGDMRRSIWDDAYCSYIDGGYIADANATAPEWKYMVWIQDSLKRDVNDTLPTNVYPETSFASGGKFGMGLNNVGGTDSKDYAEIVHSNPVESVAGIFPSGGDPSLSIEFWAALDDLSQDTQYFLDGMHPDANSAGYQMYVSKDGLGTDEYRLYFEVGDGTQNITVTADLQWNTGQYYHITGTWNSYTDTAKLYRDGVEVGSTTSKGSEIIDDPVYSVRLANQLTDLAPSVEPHMAPNDVSLNALNGYIDELRFSDIAYKYTTAQYCGDEGTVYLPADVDKDCDVDFEDFALMAGNWSKCSDPNDPNCDQYWELQ